jgi:hypothetical protein
VQPLLLDQTRRRHGGGGTRRERLECPLVVGVETRGRAEAIEGHEHAETVTAMDEGNEQGAARLRHTELARPDEHLLRGVDSEGATRPEHLAGCRGVERDRGIRGHVGVASDRGDASWSPWRSQISSPSASTSARARSTINSRIRGRSVSLPTAVPISRAVRRVRDSRALSAASSRATSRICGSVSGFTVPRALSRRSRRPTRL